MGCPKCAALRECDVPPEHKFCGACSRPLFCVAPACRLFLPVVTFFCPGCAAPQMAALPTKARVWKELLETASDTTPETLLAQLRTLVLNASRLEVFKRGPATTDELAVILRHAHSKNVRRASHCVGDLRWQLLATELASYRQALRSMMELVVPMEGQQQQKEPFDAAAVNNDIKEWLKKHQLDASYRTVAQNLTPGRSWKRDTSTVPIGAPPRPPGVKEREEWEVQLQLSHLQWNNYVKRRKRPREVEKFIAAAADDDSD